MKKALNIFVFLLIITKASLVAAAEDPGSETVFNLGEVVVTEKGESISFGTNVETADAERIELNNAENVLEALDTLPGVNISYGRKNQTYNVRGFDQRHIPVFFDGIPIYIPKYGSIDSDKLPTGAVSKVSLTKGVSSVLYGPNTMGGVINIVSKKPVRSFEGDITAGYSDKNTYYTNVNLGSKLNKIYFTASGSILDSDGFVLSDDFDDEANANENGGTRENSDKKSLNLAFKAGLTPIKGHEYALGINLVDSEYGLPPVADGRARYWRFPKWEKTTIYFIGNTAFTDELKMKTRLYRDDYYNKLKSYDDETYTTQTRRYAFTSVHDAYNTGGSLLLSSQQIKNNTASFSFSYKKSVQKEKDGTEDPWEKYEIDTFSYGLEDKIKAGDNIEIVVGLSYDLQDPIKADGGDLRDSESVFNPQAGITYTFWEKSILHASAAKKTRFPTLSELYSGFSQTDQGDYIPNPHLEEEKTINYEIGIEHPVSNIANLSLNLFYSDVKNLISKKEIELEGEEYDQYQNIGKARYQGCEFSITSDFIKNNRFEAHYTYTDGKNRSSGRETDKLEDISKDKIYISDLYTFNQYLSFFAKAVYNSKRDEDGGRDGWIKISDFWTADAKIIGNLHKKIKVEAGVRNIFDEDYEYAKGLPQPGRTFFGRVKASF